MRIGFIGCVEFSYRALQHLLGLSLTAEGKYSVVGVVTKMKSAINSDFCDLSSLADEAGIPFHYYKGQPNELLSFFQRLDVDVVYCFGWSHLLPRSILDHPRLGVIGFHPAALPMNRGRHPLIWALALGLRETGSTFFRMDEGADTGDILSQKLVRIDDEDTAFSLYDKVTGVALTQIGIITEEIASGICRPQPQNHALANTWRKRSSVDGEIDWRMSASSIHNLVRALTHPYVGAHTLDEQNQPIKIWQTKVESSRTPAHFEPGKVLKVDGNEVLVKCGDNSGIWLVEHKFKQLPAVGSYLR